MNRWRSDHHRYGRSYAWANWYISRGRLSFNPTPSELRRLSWRRAH